MDSMTTFFQLLGKVRNVQRSFPPLSSLVATDLSLLSAGIGVFPVVWFGYDDDLKNQAWKGRRDTLLETLNTNPKAPFVVRGVQFGSE